MDGTKTVSLDEADLMGFGDYAEGVPYADDQAESDGD